MSVIQTVAEIGGIQYDYTYSDANRYVVRDGISYAEAYDQLNSGREYVEGEPMDSDEQGASELLSILLGGSDD